MKHYQKYVRLILKDSVTSLPLTNMRWYPLTEVYGLCGRIIDNKGESYLIDLEAITASPNWQVIEIEVAL